MLPSFEGGVRDFVSRRYGLQEWPFMNPAYVASLLYCLIAVSRHLFVGDQVEEAFWDQQVPAVQMCSYFDVKKASPKVLQKSSQFLRRLRNSIAHVRYDIIDERGKSEVSGNWSGDWTRVSFVFRAKPPNADVDDFEVSAPAAMVMKFLAEVGAKLANLRTASAPTQ